jgi:serine/threonine protein kinase
VHQPRDWQAEEELRGLPRPGEIFDGKYRIDGVLGIGGMGVVLAATHLRLEERVAIKFLQPQFSSDPEIVQRFIREGRASIKIRSEHVVRVLDVGLAGELPYLVLEYLSGKDLDALVQERGSLEVPAAVDLVLQACEALAEAHTGGVVHRDLKPANLFLTQRADGSPCVKVLDFGISKVTRSSPRVGRSETRATRPHVVMGSPPYMSPEQMQSSKDADARSDIWSMGAILYELVAGRPPFEAETITELCARVLRDPPTPLKPIRGDLPPAFEATVFRCLEKSPDDRFHDVAELALSLGEFGTDAGQASAERVARIVERSSAPRSGSRPTPTDPSSPRAKARARASSSLSPPLRSRAPAYLFGASALVALGAVLGTVAVRHSSALRRAEERLALVQGTPALDAMPEAQAETVPVPVSRLMTTSSLVRARASILPSDRPDATASAEGPIEGRARTHQPPSAQAFMPRTATTPPPQQEEDVPPRRPPQSLFAPQPAAPPATPQQPSTDPDTLFDGRK